MVVRMLKRKGIRGPLLFSVLFVVSLIMYKLIADLEPLPHELTGPKDKGTSRDKAVVPESNNTNSTDDSSKPGDSDGLKRTLLYCNSPFDTINGNEGEVPVGYELRMLHVFIRHGDRTPLYPLPGFDLPDLDCNFKSWYAAVGNNPKFKKFPQTAVKNATSVNIAKAFRKFSMYPDRDACAVGHLTSRGSLQHLHLGQYFYDRYHHSNNLFASNGTARISVRSSVFDRTFKSAVAFTYGLLPDFTKSTFTIDPSHDLYMCGLPQTQCNCPIIQTLYNDYQKNINSTTTKLYQHEQKAAYEYLAEKLDIEPSTIGYASRWLDSVLPAYCHNKGHLCASKSRNRCLDNRVLDLLWRDHAHHESLKTQDSDRNYLKLSYLQLFPVLNEISQKTPSILRDDRLPTFRLYSGHDKTITALRLVLGIFDPIWPHYASRIVFEIYESKSKRGRLYMRILYNGDDVTNNVIFCKVSDKSKGNLCEFKLFQNYVSTQMIELFGKHDYMNVCNM